MSLSDEVACVEPEICHKVCNNPISCSNIAYPKLVLELMPSGERAVRTIPMLCGFYFWATILNAINRLHWIASGVCHRVGQLVIMSLNRVVLTLTI